MDIVKETSIAVIKSISNIAFTIIIIAFVLFYSIGITWLCVCGNDDEGNDNVGLRRKLICSVRDRVNAWLRSGNVPTTTLTLPLFSLPNNLL